MWGLSCLFAVLQTTRVLVAFHDGSGRAGSYPSGFSFHALAERGGVSPSRITLQNLTSKITQINCNKLGENFGTAQGALNRGSDRKSYFVRQGAVLHKCKEKRKKNSSSKASYHIMFIQ